MTVKRKKSLISLCVCLLLSLSIIFGVGMITNKTVDSAEAATTGFNENNIVFRIANITDSHIGVTFDTLIGNGGIPAGSTSDYGYAYPTMDNLRRAFDYYYDTYGTDGIDAIMHEGDMTENGLEENVDSYFTVQDLHFAGKPFVFALGNHDCYWTGCMSREGWYNALNKHNVYQYDRDLDSAKSQGNRHTVVEKNGVEYHFVSVDIVQYGYNTTTMKSYNYLSDATKTWLVKTLNDIERSSANRFPYIFVNSHSPAKNDAFCSLINNEYEDVERLYSQTTSTSTGLSIWGSSQDLDDILKDYNDVILMTGHTHSGVASERNINQNTYTQINCGSVSDWDSDGKGEFKRESTDTSGQPQYPRTYGEGMVVEIDNNGAIRIQRIDFTNGTSPRSKTSAVIKSSLPNKGYWNIQPYSADGSHLKSYSSDTIEKNNKAPYWGSADATATTTRASVGGNIEVDFPRAYDDDMIHYYKIELYDETTGKIVQTVRSLSPFYNYPTLGNLPNTCYYIFTAKGGSSSVSAGYSVIVTPYDSYGLAGVPLVATYGDSGLGNGFIGVRGEQQVGGHSALDGHSWMGVKNYGSAIRYNKKVKLDGLTVKSLIDTTQAGAVGFGFAKTSGVCPIEQKNAFNAIFWPAISYAPSQTRLIFAKDHDYADANCIAYADEACTTNATTSYGTLNLVYDLGKCSITLKFTKLVTNWRVDVLDSNSTWTGNYKTFYVPATYFDNVMDENGCAYLMAEGFGSDSAYLMWQELTVTEQNQVARYNVTSSSAYNNTYNVSNLSTKGRTLALVGTHKLTDMEITISSDNCATYNIYEYFGVVLKDKPLYTYVNGTAKDTTGLHIIVKPAWKNTAQTRLVINTDGSDDTETVYQDIACTQPGFGVSSVAWVGSNTSSKISFTIKFSYLSANNAWKVELSNIVGTTSYNGSQATVCYIKADVMANYMDANWQTYVMAYGNSDRNYMINETVTIKDLANTVTFDKNNGTGTMGTQTIRYGATKNLIANTFTRDKYTFKGWSSTNNGAVEYTDKAGFAPDGSNKTLYAVWDYNYANYTVKHLKQNLDGSYTEAESEVLEGLKGSKVTAKKKSYTGFTAQAGDVSGTVAADGSLVLTVKYDRNIYKVNYTVGETTTYDNAKYGETVTLRSFDNNNSGKIALGWEKDSKVYGKKTTLTVEQETSYTLTFANAYQLSGASVRLVGSMDESGIRFLSEMVNVDDGIYKGYKNISSYVTGMGMIIMPNDKIVEGKDFTYENYHSETGGAVISEMPAKDFEFESEVMSFAFSVVDLNAQNFNRAMAGRTFIDVKYSDNTTDRLYTDFVPADNVRKINDIATMCINDVKNRTETGAFKYGGTVKDNVYRYTDSVLTFTKDGNTFTPVDSVNATYRTNDGCPFVVNSVASATVTDNVATLKLNMAASQFESLLSGRINGLIVNGVRTKIQSQSYSGGVLTLTFNV